MSQKVKQQQYSDGKYKSSNREILRWLRPNLHKERIESWGFQKRERNDTRKFVM